MCLAVPGKIIEIIHTTDTDKPVASAAGPLGIVDFQGSRVDASLAMTPNAAIGDWVLVHAGFAIAQLDDDPLVVPVPGFAHQGPVRDDEPPGADDDT